MNDWVMICKFYASSFEGLKSIASQICREISVAKSLNQLPLSGGGGGMSTSVGYDVTIQTPLSARIIELRREADELEKQLNGSEHDR